MKYATLAIKALLTLAFLAAGLAKLAGADMMVGTFDALGFGQWFRYVTGVIEITAALMLWAPRLAGLGAVLLTATMACAVLAHLLILEPSALPAAVLGVLSAYVAWINRKDIPIIGASIA